MVVGRSRGGAPLAGDSTRFDEDGANHFGFRFDAPRVEFRDAGGARRVAQAARSDLDGRRCPFVAHIRKVNPRDAPTDHAGETATAALPVVRRGIPWGRPFDEDPDGERGLLFLGYYTSIEHTFGALTAGWMNQPDAPEGGTTGWDLLARQNERFGSPRMARFPGAHGVGVVETRGTWVTPTGGGFFFAPSVATLGALARANPLPPRPAR
jgi:deferrochelatase/peroxidase EfeB